MFYNLGWDFHFSDPAFLAFYGPMIYTAPYVMVLKHADPLRGQVGGDWALEIKTFWALWNCIKPLGECHLGPKKSRSRSGSGSDPKTRPSKNCGEKSFVDS